MEVENNTHQGRGAVGIDGAYVRQLEQYFVIFWVGVNN